MKGTRVADGELATNPFQPGAYGRAHGHWHACVPHGEDGLLANLSKHEVTEHDDGTITVEPSILVHGGDGREWHGFLRAGVWSEC